MSSYFQMGHDTENLVGEDDLNEFKGIVLSPVNRDPYELYSNIITFRKKGEFDIILDPQLYFPRSKREKLIEQPYFPSDLDTADMFSTSWWNQIIKDLTKYAEKLSVNSVTSPVIIPKVWDDNYYARCAEVSTKLYENLLKKEIKTFSTLMVNLNQLGEEEYIFKIASIISDASISGYYIVFYNDIDPRRELSSYDELFGVMLLIKELKNSNLPILISFCSSDMLLFKAAGADHCASGKFFNLRRFTKSRFDEPSKGGGVLPYWFEHSLLAFIREADILRLLDAGHNEMIMQKNSKNLWSNEILNQLKGEKGVPWLRLSWRQYLSWFGKTELEFSNKNSFNKVQDSLKQSEDNWLLLEDEGLLFDEPRNNGSWIRPWRQAMNKFSRRYNL